MKKYLASILVLTLTSCPGWVVAQTTTDPVIDATTTEPVVIPDPVPIATSTDPSQNGATPQVSVTDQVATDASTIETTLDPQPDTSTVTETVTTTPDLSVPGSQDVVITQIMTQPQAPIAQVTPTE